MLSPETSGGTKSFVLDAARGFLLELAHGAVLEARFAGTVDDEDEVESASFGYFPS